MPKQYDQCVAELTAQGVPSDHACRACEVAFWQQHGVTVGTALANGFEPAGEPLMEAAGVVAAELAASNPEDTAAFVPSGELRILDYDTFAKLNAEQPDLRIFQGNTALLRECEVLEPGTYNGFPFSAEECQDYVRNFDPADPPLIIKDHNLADADNSHGYVRALRWDEANQKVLALAEFLGAHACERVEDRRWKKLSGRFIISKSPERRRMTELSVTLKPAYAGARIGAKTKEVHMSEGAAKLSQAPPGAVEQPNDQVATLAQREAAVAAKEAELEAKLAAEQKRALERRKREDQKDWELLLHQGLTVPHLKDKELAFMGRLSEEDKEAYLDLRQSDNSPGRRLDFGRKSVPETIDKVVSLAADDDRQEVLLQSARAAVGIPLTKEGTK